MSARTRRIAVVATLFLLAVVGSAGCSHRSEPTIGSLSAAFRPNPVAPRSETISGPWVLWFGLGQRFWSRHSGYATLEECQSQAATQTAQAALSRALGQQLLERGAGMVPGVGGAVTSSITSSLSGRIADSLIQRFVCLAEDVDPRTPPKDKEDPATHVTSP